jgi:hypothetical protein
MKTKKILTLLIAFVLTFQSCEKEEENPINNVTKPQSSNQKSNTFGDIENEVVIYRLGESVNNYFMGETPTVGEWTSHFYENYSPEIQIPSNTPNQNEFDNVVENYLDELFSSNFTVGSNSFRDIWLMNVSNNTTLNNNEKNLISNLIYISNAYCQIVYNDGSTTEAHPWEGRFNKCMRDQAPKGPFQGFAWVISGYIFLDVGDCIGVASDWW